MTKTYELLTQNTQSLTTDLLNYHPDAIIYCQPVWSETEADKKLFDFQVSFANRKASDTFPISTHQLLSHISCDSSLKKTLFDQLQHVLQHKQSTEQQYHNPHTHNSYKLLCTRMHEGVMVTIRDVTNEVKSKQQAELNARILDTTNNGLLVLEAVRNQEGNIIDFVFVKANKPFADFTGWNETFIGKSSATLLPQIYELFRLKCLVMETGETASYKYNYNREDNNKWFQITLTKFGENRLLETVADITETKKREEERLQQSNNRLQIVFDTARAGMYTLMPVRNEQGEIIDFRFGIVNQSVASYLGLHAEDMIGALGSLYFPAYKTNGLFDRYVETMKTGNPATFDIHYTDGYDNYFTINTVKMGDELFATFTDHSPFKRLQRELEASISELKRSNASLEQFAHAASHDLQEPLRKITLYANKLQEHHADELTDEAYGYLERIRTASKRMQRLITDLLVFAEVGTNYGEMEEVALNPLLQEVLNDLEVAIAEREAIVEIENLGSIKGDSLHLQQLFQNLISNSIKYSRHDKAPHIKINATRVRGLNTNFPLGEYEAAKDYLQIQLQDNGQGFDNEQAQQIFKIFQRLPQHRNEYTGTGIGLAIVQRVVENHKGYIKAEGIPGEGATFTILLPVSTSI